MAFRSPHQRRKRLIFALVGVMAVVLTVLLVLIAAGVLVLPSHTPAPVQIDAVAVQILQGTTATGESWFHMTWFNVSSSAEGYPVSVSPGGSWSIPIPITNWDSINHTIYDVVPSSTAAAYGFKIRGTDPVTPVSVPAMGYTEPGENIFAIYVTTPNLPGTTYQSITIVVNALTPS